LRRGVSRDVSGNATHDFTIAAGHRPCFRWAWFEGFLGW
jgi:hypothetical protein